MASDWWSPSLGLPQTSEFVTAYGKQYSNSSLSGIVMAYSVVRVVCDAISQAGSLDPNAINSAIGKINKTYPTGHIQFRANRTAVLQAVEDQWQSMNTARVYPATQGAASIETPVPGLG
jgi:ABC-type branched-subunit amino acid transport system substrate-binding protein